MGAVRIFASRLLRAALRRAPAGTREWAEAMLSELDYIESDWAALSWALGSVTAIFRHASRDWLAQIFQSKQGKENNVNELGKRTAGVLTGVGFAIALVFTIFGIVSFVAIFVPSLRMDSGDWVHILTVFILPEIIFVIAAVALWKKRGPVAAGILVTAVLFAVHVTWHFVVR